MSDEPDEPQGAAAYRRLLDDIRRGDLAPGARLRETELAERLGISRTPVREAIRMLEADDLVTHQPRLGATVRRLGHGEVVELYEMRAVLEGTAARLAARGAAMVEIEELAALNEAMARAASPEAARDLNRQFHHALQQAARNRFLGRTMAAIGKAMLILGPTTLTDPARAAEVVAEHAEILTAVAGRDGPRAEAAMRAHIEAALKLRLRDLRKRDPEAET